MRNRTSDLRLPRSDTLVLSYRDLKVSEVYYEVHMTCVLHTARISNVDSVMFVPHSRQDKNNFLYFFAELKTYHLPYSIGNDLFSNYYRLFFIVIIVSI